MSYWCTAELASDARILSAHGFAQCLYEQVAARNPNLFIGPHTDGLIGLASSVVTPRRHTGAADDSDCDSTAMDSSCDEECEDDGSDDEVAVNELEPVLAMFKLPESMHSGVICFRVRVKG